jgi:radical SAM protein with 4Fe4S-binding SPASM domain
MAYALGLGLTNECNLSCAHCYRATDRVDRLSIEDVRSVIECLDFGSVNLGTGENAMHPEFLPIVELLLARGIKTTLTSNGYSVQRLPDSMLKELREVEFSFDFPTPAEQDAFRGAGAWDLAMGSLLRARRLGVEVTIIAVMMRTNYKRLPEIARLAAGVGANFRFNVYQPVQSSRFTMSYEEFWDGFRELVAACGLVTCTEPLVNALSGLNSTHGCPCGRRTIRVTPERRIIPCVYWPDKGLPLGELPRLRETIFQTPEFQRCRIVPQACRGCRYVETCGGGCAGRRILAGDVDQPDPYCPVIRHDPLRLSWQRADGKFLLKSGSACTTVLAAGPIGAAT